MSRVPDAWEDEWSSTADVGLRIFGGLPAVEHILTLMQKAPTPTEDAEPKKVSTKVTKAQKRAQQAEFNRQLWAEA